MRDKSALAVIAIAILILLIVSVPKFYEAWNQKRQNITMADMRTIGTALEAWGIDRNSYAIGPKELPSLTPFSIEEIERALKPLYVKKLPHADAWGHPFDVRISTKSYAIRSPGSNGVYESNWYTFRAITDVDEDLVFSDGNFIQFREGI